MNNITNDDNKNIKKYKDSEVIKRLLSYMNGYKKTFFICLFLTLIFILVDLAPALIEGNIIGILNLDLNSTDPEYLKANKNIIDFAKWMINTFDFVTKDNYKLSISLFLVGIFTFIIISSAIIHYISNIMLQNMGQRIIMKIREDVFIHIENLDMSDFNKIPVGRFVTRVTGDINQINELYSNIIVNLIRHILTMIFATIMLIILSPTLAIYLLFIGLFLFVITLLFRIISRNQFRRVRGSISNINSFLSENLSQMKIIEIFNQEDKKIKEFDTRNNELTKNNIKQIICFGIFRPLIITTYVLTRVLVLYKGFYLIKQNKLTVSNYVSFYQYISNFFNPIQSIADQFNQMQLSFAASEKIFTVLDMKINIVDDNDSIEIKEFKEEIEFKNVWFKYVENEWILKDVSFKIKKGESCAFVGATGAGKTTILSLITRNYDIQKGDILIDGISIKKIKISSLRHLFGVMLQDVFLFSGTIKDNITLYEDKFSDEKVLEAAKFVNADKIINKYDDNIYHLVEEKGVNYSMGERQLISFARTIIYKPQIMVLDEATSNIDTKTELLIEDSLSKMMNIGTMIIVAHRLSTIQHVDNIIVLSHGEIIESGNHQKLLKKKGMYYKLYLLQYQRKD